MPIYIFHRKIGGQPINLANDDEALLTARRGSDVFKIEFAPTGRIVWEAKSESKFKIGDSVKKSKGSQWQGKIVGTYSTNLTPEGYCVESDSHAGSVQLYPAAALEIL